MFVSRKFFFYHRGRENNFCLSLSLSLTVYCHTYKWWIFEKIGFHAIRSNYFEYILGNRSLFSIAISPVIIFSVRAIHTAFYTHGNNQYTGRHSWLSWKDLFHCHEWIAIILWKLWECLITFNKSQMLFIIFINEFLSYISKWTCWNGISIFNLSFNWKIKKIFSREWDRN